MDTTELIDKLAEMQEAQARLIRTLAARLGEEEAIECALREMEEKHG